MWCNGFLSGVMITILLTEVELQSLAGLLDLAVKAGGLRVSAEALNLANKLEVAFAEYKKSKETDKSLE